MVRASRIAALFLLVSVPALARYDGSVDPDVHAWFEQQTSHGGKILCCSEADGHVLAEEQWRTRNGQYQVLVDGKWLDVPRDAIVDPGVGPNPLARPIVWYRHLNGFENEPTIDCFCPGTMG